jgi:hypothetical protein
MLSPYNVLWVRLSSPSRYSLPLLLLSIFTLRAITRRYTVITIPVLEFPRPFKNRGDAINGGQRVPRRNLLDERLRVKHNPARTRLTKGFQGIRG